MPEMTRRTALFTFGLAPTLLFGRTKATAFALIGDRYHNSDYIRIALSKTLVGEAGVSIDFCDDVTRLDSEELQGYKLLIVFRDGMLWPDGYANEKSNAAYVGAGSPKIVSDPPLPEWQEKALYWIRPDQGAAVKRFAASGGSVFFYHNSTYISPHNDDLRDVLGAVTQGHPPIRPFKVKVVNHEHPITRGVKDFIVTDEQHFMTYQKDPKYLLLRSENEDGLTYKDLGTSSAAGWAYDYGKGRVCYLAPGHMISDLWNPEYVKLQQNAIRWLLRRS